MYARDRTTILDRREMLRVKLKTLAAEARIIRHETERMMGRRTRTISWTDNRGIDRTRTERYGGKWGPLQQELSAHRLRVVRDEARHTVIAFTLIRGKPLESVERPDTWGQAGYAKVPNWDRVRGMIKRYGPKGFVEPALMLPPAVKSLTALEARAQQMPALLGGVPQIAAS